MPDRRRSSSELSHCKACEIEDFSHPDLLPWLRDVFPHELRRFGADFPAGREYRKYWEVAMSARALGHVGLLTRTAEILGVGAGNEPTLFWLTTKVRRVFATDLYLAEGWEESASATMLIDPGEHWPGRWDPERLVVQHMDALELRHPAESFDAVFSSSSIEHFGDEASVAQAIREMWRVLRPGGVAVLSTELRLTGPPPGLPGVLMFDRDGLERAIIKAAPWQPISPLDTKVSPRTVATAQPFADAAADVRRHVAEHSRIRFEALEWSRYPHVVLVEGNRSWTSVHLALRKTG